MPLAPDAPINVARRWWRPVFAFLATACVVAVVAVVCWLLITGRADLASAQAVLITIITALSAPLSVFIGGRSYEKVQGASDGVLQTYELHGAVDLGPTGVDVFDDVEPMDLPPDFSRPPPGAR